MAQEKLPVGKKVRVLREQKGYSLRRLAEQSGLSLNAISLIERGENSPTVSSLQMLATALEVPIIEFFKEESDQAIVFVKPSARLRSEINGINMESLVIGLPNQQLEPFLLTVAPGRGNLSQPISHTGEEFVYCLEGTIDYCVGQRIFHLEPGYSLLFEATIPHCFYNGTALPTLLIIVFHAGNGSQSGRRLHMEFATEEDRNEDIY